jgi:hypothetical protein
VEPARRVSVARAVLGGAVEAAVLLASALLLFRIGGDWIDTMVAALGLMIGGPIFALAGGWLGLRASRSGGPWRFGGGRQVLASLSLLPLLAALEVGLGRAGALPTPRPATDPFAGVSSEGVRAALVDREATRRVLAARELLARGDPGALEALLPLLADPLPEVRGPVARLVGELRSEGVYEALRPLVGDPDLGVRLAAVAALGRCSDPRVVDALAPVLDDALLAGAAADALAETGDPKAVPPLIARLERLTERGSDAERQRVAAALRKLAGRQPGGADGLTALDGKRVNGPRGKGNPAR